MLTLVHGPSSKLAITPFWEQLMTLVESFFGPWLCYGDFNCILSQEEKKGGRPFVESSRGDLREFLY